MRCPRCGAAQANAGPECGACGIVFAKWLARQAAGADADAVEDEVAAGELERATWGARLWALATQVPDRVDPVAWGGRACLWLVLLIWGGRFVVATLGSDYPMRSVLHLVNTPFHEAGHVLFGPFGDFLTKLGGSLLQVLIPLLCGAVFLVKSRDPFAASVMLWWCGQNFIELGPYIADARALRLVLIGGVTGAEVEDYHDWEAILGALGWLDHDRRLAWASHAWGSALIAAASAWGAWLLWRQRGTRPSAPYLRPTSL